MNQKIKDKLINYIIYLSLMAILITGIFAISNYISFKKDSCRSDPFGYGVRELEEQYDTKIYGSISFSGSSEPLIFTFDSNGLSKNKTNYIQ